MSVEILSLGVGGEIWSLGVIGEIWSLGVSGGDLVIRVELGEIWS